MKNTIYKLLLTVSSLVLIIGCSNELDTEPITDVEANNQAEGLKSAKEAETALTSVLGVFANEYWQFDHLVINDAGSDGAYAGADQEAFFQIDEYRINSTNYVVARDWGHLQDFVKRCNLIINYVNAVTDPALTQTRKDEMMGQACLVRALTRFYGTQTWGEFPLVDKYVSSINGSNFAELYPSLYPERKSVSAVYDAIIADLQVAIAKCPDASNKYLPNKGGAKALLAKVYATKPSPDWTKVNQYCDEVIAGGYSLLTDYDFLFDSAHEGNAESIWEINGEGPGSLINAWCTNVFRGSDWKKFNTPTHTLNSALDAKRRKSTILMTSTTFSDIYWPSFITFPYPNKMRKTDGTQNFYLLRLADILLLKAEALAHQNDLVGAMAMVNKTRNRVGLANIASATSMDDAINKILQERFVELGLEGHRWFDLKREGKSIEILGKQTYTVYDPVTQTLNFKPLPYIGNLTANDLVWPIPQSVLDNNPNIKQNPGY